MDIGHRWEDLQRSIDDRDGWLEKVIGICVVVISWQWWGWFISSSAILPISSFNTERQNNNINNKHFLSDPITRMIHWLHLCRGVRLTQRVSWIWHKAIWSWGFCTAGVLENVEYPFIAIIPRSTRARSDSTWLGPIYESNRTKLYNYARINCLNELSLHLIVCKQKMCIHAQLNCLK